ncbi:8965_t:CDS:2 [Scutellospora calospora]|uniref:8965_t:CDS:1 n=1 Tax=Scutellospora calospora TaxID=85575 RepID=A0ACA9NJ20_9GLOM|nr:8965_t:CDS:2 [Scutellospora calospora]
MFRKVESHDPETEFVKKQTCEIVQVEKQFCEVDVQVERQFCEVGIQIGKQFCEVSVQISESIIQNLENYVYLLQEQLNKKISEIEDL